MCAYTAAVLSGGGWGCKRRARATAGGGATTPDGGDGFGGLGFGVGGLWFMVYGLWFMVYGYVFNLQQCGQGPWHYP